VCVNVCVCVHPAENVYLKEKPENRNRELGQYVKRAQHALTEAATAAARGKVFACFSSNSKPG